MLIQEIIPFHLNNFKKKKLKQLCKNHSTDTSTFIYFWGHLRTSLQSLEAFFMSNLFPSACSSSSLFAPCNAKNKSIVNKFENKYGKGVKYRYRTVGSYDTGTITINDLDR